MEDVPPSYEHATTRNHWRLVAPYIHSSDLCSASRVCAAWHTIFEPFLWGNPASHFGTENDRVYVALTRFKRTLKIARLSVRQLTHTLHLPPAQSEIYDGPHPEWLRDVLEQLPHLQTLVVSRLPFFDHASLHALRLHSDPKRSVALTPPPTYALRLLIAVQCRNTTSTGLAEALIHLPNLVFLDLSNTTPAKDKNVLSTLRYMANLQVVKLRQVNLRDEDLETLAHAVGIRIRSLDVRSNILTDKSVNILLRSCFEHSGANNGLIERGQQYLSGAAFEDWPSGIARPEPDLLDDFRHDALDEHFMKQLAKPTVRRLPSEDLPHSGITHLYISDNLLTTVGLIRLLESRCLFVLDVGVPSKANTSQRHGSFSSPPRSIAEDSAYTLGLDKIISFTKKPYFENLTWLRIHHSVVTQKILVGGKNSSPAVSSVSYEMSAEQTKYELDAAPPVLELTIEKAESRYELQGDSIHLLVSPAIGETPSLESHKSLPSPKGGGAFAPEAVEEPIDEAGASPILSLAGLLPMAQATNGISGDSRSFFPLEEKQGLLGKESPQELSIALIHRQRQELRSRQREKPSILSPGMLPKLRTLILIDIPCSDPHQGIVDGLVQFISDCASEAELAELGTSLIKPQKNFSLGLQTMGRTRSGGKDAFALSKIVLEMAPPASISNVSSNPFRVLQDQKFAHRTKSSTEDADSEALWSAQENDFSFFGEDEECGLPAMEQALHPPIAMISEKMVLSTEELQIDTTSTPKPLKKAGLGMDVIQELANFRKSRKAAYDVAVQKGERFVDGYWPGEVKIVRWHARESPKSGMLDYYGNCYEKGIYR